jgi:serine protease Do
MRRLAAWIRRCGLLWRMGVPLRPALAAVVLTPLLLAPCTGLAQAPADPHSPEVQAKIAALERAHAAVVGIRSVAVDNASSSENLGQVRQGSGVVIGSDGLIVTIGYLIIEAADVELEVNAGRTVPARVVAYDLASGFGLLQALTPLHVAPVKLGNSKALKDDDPLMIASGGDEGDLSMARLVSRRAYSGYWEYHLDDALFTAPPRTDHSGAALFNADGELLGIGALVVMDALGPEKPGLPGNMFVPVDLLKSILPELRAHGATRSSTRPWLGLNCVEIDGIVRVVRVMPAGPAADAGIVPGDIILRIDGADVNGLEGFYKTLWRGGPPERDIALVVSRGGAPMPVTAHSKDRMKTLRQARGV